MLNLYRYVFFVLCFLFSGSFILAQDVPEFNMMDTTVTICKGDLYDSGGPGNIYKNNENYTFKICTGSPVSMSFTSNFCVETTFDKLRFFDGNDTLAPQIGPAYSGNNPPPVITANSGCLTVNFVSDSNVAYCGWHAHWSAPVIPPVPPVVQIAPVPVCNSNTVSLSLSKAVRCDSLRAADFTINGPMLLNVVSVAAQNCVNNMTSGITLTLDKPISQSCNYDVQYVCRLPDNCDSIWTFILNTNFFINTCPFTVAIVAVDDTICPGNCTSIRAVVTGCQTYSYTWNNGLPNGPGPFQVCPGTTTAYSVFVQETSGTGYSDSDIKNISVLSPQIGIPDTVLCQSDTSFIIPASPGGGYWIGQGMTDTIAGIFTPDSAGPGNHYIKYVLGKLCRDSVLITVKPMDAGLSDAACPFSPPFFLNGYEPAGGTWTGDSILANGLFSPADTGVYNVTYNYNGCSESKKIYINNVSTQATDTICQSVRPFNLQFYPPGGRWYGPGISDSLLGTFVPDAAGGGLHKPVYYMYGCSDTVPIYIKHIQAGNNFTVCPLQPPFVITPAASPSAGTWNGLGISNPVSGLYDPSLPVGTNFDLLTYLLPNGCQDTVIVDIELTKINIDTLFFCEGDNRLILNYGTTRRSPGGGVWSGNGIVKVGSNFYFDPAVSGSGEFMLTYLVNTCADSMLAIVFPKLNVKDTFMCTVSPPVQLQQMPAGGYWSGPGITDMYNGIFDASIAGADTHYVKFSTPECIDSVRIVVYQFIPAKIGGIDTMYCFIDTNLQITLTPPGGVFIADSSVTGNIFNPSKASIGMRTMVYSFGTGSCRTVDSIRVHVFPPLITTVSVTNDTICKGEGAKISIAASGGKPGAIVTHQWSHGLFPVSSHTVSPATTTTYYILTSDGCSEDVTDSVTIYANPQFTVNFTSSSIDCFGTNGFAKADVIGIGDFQIEWSTSPVSFGDSVLVKSGRRYTVIITDTVTGCHLDTLIDIPGFSVMKALFSVNPNMECISFEENPITFIDLSKNVKTGEWNFGSGNTMPYTKGVNPQISFEPGTYTVSLNTVNEGGCKDSHTIDICVFGPEAIFIPDAFSPNNDGQNDVLYVRGVGVKKIFFQVYDRWGENVFTTENQDIGWDGNFRGQAMNTGVYFYFLKATLFNNKEVTLKGDVSILK